MLCDVKKSKGYSRLLTEMLPVVRWESGKHPARDSVALWFLEKNPAAQIDAALVNTIDFI